MKPFIRIFVPDGDRLNFWVVLFHGPAASVTVHETDTAEQAESLASRLAQEHACHFKFMPPVRDVFRHWWTEDGRLREINRVEFVSLGRGLIQFNVWSDNVRISAEACRASAIDELLDETRLLISGSPSAS